MSIFKVFQKFDYDDLRSLLAASLIVALVFSTVMVAGQVYAETDTVTLTVTVDRVLTMVVSTDQFGTLTPGTPKNATSTLAVTTNATNGWVVALSGDDQATGNTAMDHDSDASVGITDQTQWVPGAATTTAGNAALISAFTNSGNVLAFRVMSASSTNGTAFLSTSWWGTADCYTSNVAGCLWAGIASSTPSVRTIGQASAGSYSATTHINTVQYYLNVATTQQSGAYSAPLTYTTTATAD